MKRFFILTLVIATLSASTAQAETCFQSWQKGLNKKTNHMTHTMVAGAGAFLVTPYAAIPVFVYAMAYLFRSSWGYQKMYYVIRDAQLMGELPSDSQLANNSMVYETEYTNTYHYVAKRMDLDAAPLTPELFHRAIWKMNVNRSLCRKSKVPSTRKFRSELLVALYELGLQPKPKYLKSISKRSKHAPEAVNAADTDEANAIELAPVEPSGL